MGRSLESPALFGDPRTPLTLPVEMRGCPWTPVESGLICLGRLIINIWIICDHCGGVCGPLCRSSSLEVLGADNIPFTK